MYGAEPPQEDFRRWLRRWVEGQGLDEDMFFALERIARNQLLRRGMLDAPPHRFGFDTFESWRAPEALRALALEFVADVLVKALERIRILVDQHPSMEGYVTLSFRNYLHERQSRSDPVGARCHENVKNLLVHGDLEHDDAEPRDAMKPGGWAWRPPRPPGAPQSQPPHRFEEALAATSVWSELIDTVGRSRGQAVRGLLQTALDELRKQGFAWIHPAELRDAFIDPARAGLARHREALAPGELPHPSDVEEALVLARFQEDITDEIDVRGFQPEKKEGLVRTLELIVQHVKATDTHITQRDLAERLELSTSAVQKYMTTLREIVAFLLKGSRT